MSSSELKRTLRQIRQRLDKRDEERAIRAKLESLTIVIDGFDSSGKLCGCLINKGFGDWSPRLVEPSERPADDAPEHQFFKLPIKLLELFSHERGKLRYRGAKGGRGSGKSMGFALMAAIICAIKPMRIACLREYQNSIQESFFAEVKKAIESSEWLKSMYDVGVESISSKAGSKFFFRGLNRNPDGIKSVADIGIAIIEEAESIPQHALDSLEPSVRADKSEIWVIWNPKRPDAPVEKYIENPPPRSEFIDINYNDNPWFPVELEEKRAHDRQHMDSARYRHIWEGAYLVNSDAQVFANCYEVREFEVPEWRGMPAWNGPYHGLDHGFAQDPAAAVKCWIDADAKVLYIEQEAYATGINVDSMAPWIIQHMPGIERHEIVADSARPDLNEYLSRNGLPRIRGAAKGKGSIEDGIEFIRSYKVVIHPRCKNVEREFDTYSYKVDRLSQQILTTIEDKNNHAIDALRYALEPISKGGDAASLWARMT